MKAGLLEQLGLAAGSLAGRTAIVTGGGQGIGKELAIALARLGANVVIAEIKDSGADVESLIRAEGGRALFVKTDVSDEGSVNSLAEKAKGAFGRVDILVNNACTVTTGSILEQSASSWDRVLAVNLKGPVILIKTFLPEMLERKDGVIVNSLSSEGMAYLAPYSASKAALQSLTSSLVAELGEGTGVSVLNFAPGMIDTPTMNMAAEKIAPRMGLTPDQFRNLGVNPGYTGMMPADDCAAGFAHAIVHAKEYHGQTADPFKPFIQSGIVNIVQEPASQPAKQAEPVATAVAASPSEAIQLGRQLQAVLAAVSKETEELDLFKRTWVKNDFSRKTGMSIKDWMTIGSELTRDLEHLASAGGNRNSSTIKGKFPYYISRVEKLAAYFRAQAENAKGYFKDPQQRDTAIAALAQRENAAVALAKALNELNK